MKRSGWEQGCGWRRLARSVLLGATAALVLAIAGSALAEPKTTPPGHAGRGQGLGHEKHPNNMQVPGRGNDGSPPARGHVPELDPGSVGAALALLAGGTLIVRGRRQRSP